uniref:Uncharacterized protein n=1 Tax=Ananas comosus var. bracteatus TaxID=296719 RepID=A0A6V7PS46_ANACO|nr:unnamed protein product [Ananas comosus var. bracteatus]
MRGVSIPFDHLVSLVIGSEVAACDVVQGYVLAYCGYLGLDWVAVRSLGESDGHALVLCLSVEQAKLLAQLVLAALDLFGLGKWLGLECRVKWSGAIKGSDGYVLALSGYSSVRREVVASEVSVGSPLSPQLEYKSMRWKTRIEIPTSLHRVIEEKPHFGFVCHGAREVIIHKSREVVSSHSGIT